MSDIQSHSDSFVAQCYADYRATPPCEKGQLVDVHDQDTGRLHAIGLVMGIDWSEKCWDYLVDVEMHDGIIETFYGAFITRHVGFCARAL